nr:glutathione S-transferase 25 [Grapholita molesta]WDQ36050.1 glutathione S-transferase sigma-2 [Grapholitha molesta]
MSKKLHYLNLNGIAESIRFILHYGGQKFEDVRYEVSEWPIKSVKDSLPYGQLPLYQEGSKTLNQSLAIARYVASQLKLVPTDPWEQAVLDAVVFNIYDFWTKVVSFIKETDASRKEAIKKEIINETIDFFFSRFEKELKANKGFFNGKLSWADFILVGIVESANLFLGTEIEKSYPAVQALVQTVRALPGVKQYLATRKPYTL